MFDFAEMSRLLGLDAVVEFQDRHGRERVMQRFRRMKSLQKFASVHANFQNHFNSERNLTDRQTFKTRRSAALADWQTLMA